MITSSTLTAIIPSLNNADGFAKGLNTTFKRFDISNNKRVAAFLAQTIWESASFSRLIENLDYTAQRLLEVFPRYVNAQQAAALQHQPAQIGNHVYANRLGNGSEASGDGWRHRGRGLIQLTGKSNHQNFGDAIGQTLAEVVPYLETIEGACMGAGWFWAANGLNDLADSDQFSTITQKVNGSTATVPQRKLIWIKVQSVMSGSSSSSSSSLDSAPACSAPTTGSANSAIIDITTFKNW